MYDRILLPTDGSDVAAVATDAAIALAGQFGADLHAVHVLESDGLGDWVGVGDGDGDGGDGDAPIHRSVLSYADERDVDCIVMGTHGRTGLDRYLLGSVTERVVRLSDVPVVTLGEADAPE